MQSTKEAASKTASFRDHSVCCDPSRSKKFHLPQLRDLCAAETKGALIQIKAGWQRALDTTRARATNGYFRGQANEI
jgi:hypothetical protein